MSKYLESPKEKTYDVFLVMEDGSEKLETQLNATSKYDAKSRIKRRWERTDRRDAEFRVKEHKNG